LEPVRRAVERARLAPADAAEAVLPKVPLQRLALAVPAWELR
jgi:hypothetical protein